MYGMERSNGDMMTTLGVSGAEMGEFLSALSNFRRVRVVGMLTCNDEEYTVGDIATRLAEVEAGPDERLSDVRKSVYISLIQTHLPSLAADDVVIYNEQAKTVRQGPDFDRVKAAFEAVAAILTTDADGLDAMNDYVRRALCRSQTADGGVSGPEGPRERATAGASSSR